MLSMIYELRDMPRIDVPSVLIEKSLTFELSAIVIYSNNPQTKY